jgi:eukaryotic-like serine/threonine-protein kinase
MTEHSNGHVTIEEITEEFLVRLKSGENPSVEEYREAYPEHADEIASIFPAMLALEGLGVEQSVRREIAQLDNAGLGAHAQRLGDFRVIREIGRGGMGVVFEAIQESLDRRVALKVLAADFTASPSDRQRFQREAEAAGKLYHPNIVPVFGAGRHERLHYYVMQYIDGVGLDTVLSAVRRLRGQVCGKTEDGSGAVSPQAGEAAASLTRDYWRRVAGIGQQVAKALEYAHEQGVVHRDIKPSNLLMDREGRVWVTDFGLARREGTEPVTMAGGLVGTLRYMAPEQFQGLADARSDVHSLGLTLHEMLALAPAFSESRHGELVRLKTTTEPPPLRGANPGIPRDLATVVQKACALDPRHRYQSAAELTADLQRFLDDRPIRARPVTPFERLWRWGRRNPAVAALSGLAAGLLLTVVLVTARGYLKTTQALSEANRQRGRAEANLSLAMEAFEKIMGDISTRGVPQSLALDLGENGVAPVGPPLTTADAELLQTLLSFFNRFAEQNQADMKAETADAYQRVGGIRQRLHQPAEAKDAYLKAVHIWEAISRAAPGDVSKVLAHARALNAMGVLEKETDATREARLAHQAALAALAAVAKPDAGADLALERARTLNLLGSVGVRGGSDNMMGAMRWRKLGIASQSTNDVRATAFGGRGRPRNDPGPGEMEGYYQEAVAVLQDLCRSDPTNADCRCELAHCQRNRALLALQEGNGAEAQGLLEQAVRSFEDLVADFPDVPQYQYELADVLCVQFPGHRGPVPLSGERTERAVDIAKRLFSTYPWMPNYQAVLATALTRRAWSQLNAGRAGESESSYRAAVAQFKSLTERTDSTPAYEMAYARALHGLGDLLREQGRFAESRDVLERAMALIESHGPSRQPAYRGLAGSLERSLSKTRMELEAGHGGH